ncbi:MAG TPA: ubiquinone/menaquinone biosynthesis methyltransferase [Micromonosporaceae bacterium]|nr:ubiquinone/menaquinone biosynthesis methyltransferase [Micromonosporaceae bacterium]
MARSTGETGTGKARPSTPQAMFDRVAPYYDRFNTLLSMGFDRRWRRRAARALRLPPGARVLDVATGTGALARTIAREAPAGFEVVGCDLNARMLAAGQARLDGGHPVRLVLAAAERLPFADDGFDAATIGFAVDDFADQLAAVRELHRVVRPGGQLVLLELSLPDQPLLRAAYRAGLAVFGLVGRLPGRAGYGHLREEITRYRGVSAVADLLARSGFTGHEVVRLTGGVATLHRAVNRPG